VRPGGHHPLVAGGYPLILDAFGLDLTDLVNNNLDLILRL
jgi:hypothetical protein